MPVRKCSVLLVSLVAFLPQVYTQHIDYTWWNEKHHWDGHTSWLHYIRAEPRYLGPNALPVPELRDGEVGDHASLRLDMENYFSAGDNTVDIGGSLVIPVAHQRVALEFFGVPLEYYKTDTIVRDERRSREYDGRGWSACDLYFGTVVQLVREEGRWPGITLGLTCKTASGDNIEGARVTDAPGYYFDLGFGKWINRNLRINGMAGFYAWQTTDVEHRQNDAFLYGIGTRLDIGGFTWEHDLSGFTGYMGRGDDPLVYRTSIGKRAGSAVFSIAYMKGLQSFPFHRLRISADILFGMKKKPGRVK